MEIGQAPPQYSRDGMWWWDGHRWVASSARQANQSQGSPRQPDPGHSPPKRKPRVGKGARLAAFLGVLASVATILSFCVALGQGSGDQGNSTPTPTPRYPDSVRADFLSSCEAGTSASECECALSWFEAHVPLRQFRDEDQLVRSGQIPLSVEEAIQACGG
jgi:hypothetical protein